MDKTSKNLAEKIAKLILESNSSRNFSETDLADKKIEVLSPEIENNQILLKKKEVTKMNFKKIFSKPSVHLVPYESTYEDIRYKNNFPEISRKVNERFKLRVYLPKLVGKKYNSNYKFDDFFLMINGFAEFNSSVYDHMGLSLAEEGIPSIFFPLPFHFVRGLRFHSEEYDPYKIQKKYERLIPQFIIQAFLKTPTRFNDGFLQILEEVKVFVRSFKDSTTKSFLKEFIKSDPDISLFGHSLGGLISLSIMMSDYALKGEDIDKCSYKSVFLLESGASLDQVKVNKLLYRNDSICRKLYDYYITEKNPIFEFEEFFHNKVESDKKKAFESFFQLKENSESEIPSVKAFLIDLPASVSNTIKKKIGNIHPGYEEKMEKETKELIESKFKELLNRDIESSNKIWNDAIEELYNDLRNFDGAKAQDLKKLASIFYGDATFKKKKDLNNLAQNILFIVGGADDVFPLSLIQGISPDTGLALIQIPNLSHFLKSDGKNSEWNVWKSFLTNVIISFNKNIDKLKVDRFHGNKELGTSIRKIKKVKGGHSRKIVYGKKINQSVKTSIINKHQ